MDVSENTIQSSQSTGHQLPQTINPRAVISACTAGRKLPLESLTNSDHIDIGDADLMFSEERLDI